jgi:putative ABC transport system permease protein
MTGVIGALQEAWGEVRVHRARVVLSLVGVVLAVFAMTIITATGTIARQVVLESSERMSGRTTTLSVWASPTDGAGTPEQMQAVYAGLVDRFGVEYSSLMMQTGLEMPLGTGTGYVNVFFIEPDYGPIHRITPTRGRWFVAGDAERLAPAVIVNDEYLEQAGMVGAQPPFAVRLPGDPDTTATVIGVVDRSPWGPELLLLTSARFALPAESLQGGMPSLEMWVPPQDAETIQAAVPAVLEARGLQGEAHPMSDENLPGLISAAQWAVRGLSWFALALGALGVLNVGIVTVRQRIREIGVRRALGASSGRVFAAVILESVCATALAGLVGVGLAVALMVNLPLDDLLGSQGITDVPAFPLSAALEAFLAATVVGALAGLVPATIAVRSKVIDAIRY